MTYKIISYKNKAKSLKGGEIAIEFKAKGRLTEDSLELNLKIKGLEKVARQNSVEFDEVLKNFFQHVIPENNEKKQIQLPNNGGVMLIVSHK